ncbi:extracelular serine carboxypeptidase [Mycena crocata]|nr:extracelular serine carboxypeptidase [Mycena crocata]
MARILQFLALCSGILLVNAGPGSRLKPNRRQNSPAPAITVATFSQLTNHFPNDTFYGPPPVNATFTQRFVVNDTFYKPGGPVFLLDSGETSATGGRTRYLLTGVIAELAQATNGIGLIIEHRYYGTSIPVADLSTDNLRWLTTDQSIADIAYFAQNVVVPGHEDEDLTAPGCPWIVYGGSLAGAEAAFAVKTYGDIIYGGISSSGTVKASYGYPEWYYNIQKFAPKDCVKTVEDIVDKIDFVIKSNNKDAIQAMQSVFGLESLQDLRDFAIAVAFPIGNPVFYPNPTWQELNWDPAVGSNDFFEFCDSLTNPNAPAHITAIDSSLSKYTHGEKWTHLGNYGEWIKTQINPLCPAGVSLDSNDCFGTHNATAWANTLDFSGNRAYIYQSCTEAGFFPQGAPPSRRSMLARVVQPDYGQQWCVWAFPPGEHNTIPARPTLERWNKFGGLELQADRLAQVDGAQDPWEYACVHSPAGRGRKDTLLRPYYLIAEGGHHWDENGLLNISLEPGYIQAIHNYEIKFVKSWLADFDEWAKGKTTRVV